MNSLLKIETLEMNTLRITEMVSLFSVEYDLNVISIEKAILDFISEFS